MLSNPAVICRRAEHSSVRAHLCTLDKTKVLRPAEPCAREDLDSGGGIPVGNHRHRTTTVHPVGSMHTQRPCDSILSGNGEGGAAMANHGSRA